MRNVIVGVGLVAMFATAVDAQTGVAYRDFRLGSSVQSVLEASHLTSADLRTLHRRPRLIQSLEWRRPYVMGATNPIAIDPVRRMMFSFYDDQLFSIVVDYDRERTEGLTEGDIIEALAVTYGLPTVPDARIKAQAEATSSGDAIAQWNSGSKAVLVLYKAPGFSGRASGAVFMLTVVEPTLRDLSAAAVLDALRLDVAEAPEYEVLRQKRVAESEEDSAAKNRAINKPRFNP